MDVLDSCRGKKNAILRLKERVEEAEDIITSCPQVCNVVGTGSNVPGDKIGAYMAHKTELEDQIKDLDSQWGLEAQAVGLFLDKLPTSIARKTMQAFYIHGKGPAIIAREMNYSVSAIFKILAAGRQSMRGLPEKGVEAVLQEVGLSPADYSSD